jgi:hypothetical protein
MLRSPLRRFWLSSVSAAAATALAALTVATPDWIEAVFGVDPDHGDGAAECLVLIALLTAAVALGALSRIHWLRAREESC